MALSNSIVFNNLPSAPRLGNGVTLVEVLPLWDLYTTYRGHRRLKTFACKGRTCVICGKTGVVLLRTETKRGQQHIDLYTEDFTLMTNDHIIPRCFSHDDRLSNLQPMCLDCNMIKKNRLLTNEALKTIVN